MARQSESFQLSRNVDKILIDNFKKFNVFNEDNLILQK